MKPIPSGSERLVRVFTSEVRWTCPVLWLTAENIYQGYHVTISSNCDHGLPFSVLNRIVQNDAKTFLVQSRQSDLHDVM